MRILWFTNNSSCYSENTGGGWISSLERELRERENIQLGICFYERTEEKVCKNGVTYYLLPRPKKSLLYAAKQVIKDKKTSSFEQEKIAIPSLLNVVDDYKPDIIHVFGSENIFGLLVYYTKIPIVLHIQGVLSACLNAFLPPFVSWCNFIFSSRNIKQILKCVSEKIAWERNCITEQRIMQKMKHLMGRTTWDRMISETLSPKGQYYHCDEILRDAFYDTTLQRKLPSRITIVTTSSAFLYKGYDVILKTAKILKETMNLDFEWKVYGDVCTKLVYKKTKIRPESVNVILMGCASANEIKDALLNATIYVHTSYIENSPNALCEAQILGCACISTNVGGVNTLIEDGRTGLLVPANDIYQLAHQIAYLSYEKNVNITMGNAAQKIARTRHDKTMIVNRVIDIYRDVLGGQ